MTEAVALADVEVIGEEIWETLSLLAQRRMEEPVVEEEKSINVMADETTCAMSEAVHKHPLLSKLMTSPPGPEVPFDERKNVILLREAYDGALACNLSPTEFRAKMEQLKQLATVAVAIFKNPRIKREKDKLPDDQEAIIERMRSACDRLKQGVDRMWTYLASGDLARLESGYAQAEAAMFDIYVIQRDAANKADEIDKQVEDGTYDEIVATRLPKVASTPGLGRDRSRASGREASRSATRAHTPARQWTADSFAGASAD